MIISMVNYLVNDHEMFSCVQILVGYQMYTPAPISKKVLAIALALLTRECSQELLHLIKKQAWVNVFSFIPSIILQNHHTRKPSKLYYSTLTVSKNDKTLDLKDDNQKLEIFIILVFRLFLLFKVKKSTRLRNNNCQCFCFPCNFKWQLQKQVMKLPTNFESVRTLPSLNKILSISQEMSSRFYQKQYNIQLKSLLELDRSQQAQMIQCGRTLKILPEDSERHKEAQRLIESTTPFYLKSKEIIFQRLKKQQQIAKERRVELLSKDYDKDEDNSQTGSERSNLKLQVIRDPFLNTNFEVKEISIRNRQAKLERFIFYAKDMEKLKPATDLNDSIIEFYLKIVNNIQIQEFTSEKIHFFSTFFLMKLIDELTIRQVFEGTPNKVEFIRKSVSKNYKNVKRWTKNTDIFEKQLLIFPINAFNHWFCIFVLNPRFLIQESDGFNFAQIIYCDSMFIKQDHIVLAIKEYLYMEMQDKKNIRPKEGDNFQIYQLLLPRQTNFNDCGLYMLAYIEQLLKNDFDHLTSLQHIENRIKLNIFPRKLIFTMRNRLAKLILQLSPIKTEEQNKQLLLRYFSEKNEIIRTNKDDNDQIDQMELKKYKACYTSSLIQKRQFTPEDQYQLVLRFYLDQDINYYEKMILQ